MPAVQYSEPANAGGRKLVSKLSYEPGSDERKLLKAALAEMESTVTEIPSIINGKRIRTGHKGKQVNPWDRYGAPLAEYHQVDPKTIKA
ncbi:hypothetical protein AFCA_012074 [Aspergillus flavus]|uniref:Delta-1-pyrroline-5-carboxylate dehydrogenase n=1 Tax=Aspergillus flavus TaxID=5059 RepID=A0AB74CFR8_ASPFL|nr:delta-1-pyrroline-5-carboxylate dehydrogenase [Aspergillus flavus]RAQ76909.1 delta-1-pyrroline-5-carboxylate dehydrogenase [Aspergillus flavus]RMZ45456.1 delta-1-pyrroline-5-carboxylate dehydrogenase [Aspergillus flavus]UDD64873.1 hypothetical protein AFCA_012074 [Aspergillus flavus]